MSDFHYALREHLHVLRKDERLYVLMSIYLHRNIRYRAFPSNADIMKETGLTSSPVSKSIKWFVESKALIRVPYGKRVGEEKALGKHKNIYQLTGVLKLGDEFVPYLHLTPEGWQSVALEVEGLGDYSLGKYLRSEYSLGKSFTTQTQSIKESLSLSSSLLPNAVAVVGGKPQRAAPAARTENPTEPTRDEVEIFHRRKTYYQAFEAGFPDTAKTKVSDTKQNRNHARELALSDYSLDEITTLVKAKIAAGKADYRFHYLMADLAEARLRRNSQPAAVSSAPPVVRAPDELRAQYPQEVVNG